MSEDEKKMREWEARYESYRQYRSHYFTVLSIAATICVLGLALAMQGRTPWIARFLLVACIWVVVVVLVIAHEIARRAIRQLGERMKALEIELGFDDFDTSAPIEVGLIVTESACALFAALGLAILVLALLGVPLF